MIDFCLNCNSILTAKSDPDTKQLILACINCDYIKNVGTENRVLKSAITSKTVNREAINTSMLYDRALRHTTWIRCPNERCQSIDTKSWHEPLPETGLVNFPTVMITNFTNDDKIATYICKVCNTTFRGGLAEPVV